eukprot:5817009-Pyramimonas_sp.AAC.1
MASAPIQTPTRMSAASFCSAITTAQHRFTSVCHRTSRLPPLVNSSVISRHRARQLQSSTRSGQCSGEHTSSLTNGGGGRAKCTRAIRVTTRAASRERRSSDKSTSASESTPSFIIFNGDAPRKEGSNLPALLALLALIASAKSQNVIPETWWATLLTSTSSAPVYPLAITAGLVYSVWHSRAGLISSYLSSATGLVVKVKNVKLSSKGVILKGLSVGSAGQIHVGTVVIRGKLDDLSKALQAAVNSEPVSLSDINLKVHTASTSNSIHLSPQASISYLRARRHLDK